jgi:hypothetical protein
MGRGRSAPSSRPRTSRSQSAVEAPHRAGLIRGGLDTRSRQAAFYCGFSRFSFLLAMDVGTPVLLVPTIAPEPLGECVVTIDRTRPVVQGAYWTLTGRWHCGVLSILQHVRSLFCCALLRLDQRVRSVTRPARPVAPSASGLRDQHVRSVLRNLAVARPACPVSLTSASGQRDFGCLSS